VVNKDEGEFDEVGALDENVDDLDEGVLNGMRNKGELLLEHVEEMQGDLGHGEELMGLDKESSGHGVGLSGVDMEEPPSLMGVSGVGGESCWRVSLIQ